MTETFFFFSLRDFQDAAAERVRVRRHVQRFAEDLVFE
jgi:hypothetical protein